jgi:5'-methylthioadenosine nucleosidase
MSDSAARVLIVMAMEAEAEPITAALRLAETTGPSDLPCRWYRGAADHLDVLVAVNGVDARFDVDSIGTVPAALNTYAAIQAFNPDLVISAGTAGAWHRDGSVVGDVFLSGVSFVNHDRRIELRGFDAYGVGSHPGIQTRDLADRLGFKVGIVTTSNSLDETPHDAERIEASGAAVKEMEAAGVAYVAEQAGVPMMAIKAITDLVDDPAPTPQQFIDNLSVATELLAEAVVAVLLELDEETFTST